MADFYIPSTKRYAAASDSSSSGSSGKSSKSGFYTPSTKGYADNAKKRREEEEALKEELKLKNAKAEQEKKKGRGPLADLTDTIGNFAGEFAKAATAQYKRTGEGLAEVANEVTGGAERERQANAKRQEEDRKLIRSLGEKMKSSKDPAERARYQSAITKITGTSNQQDQSFVGRQNEIKERADPVKGAAAIGEIGLDVLTAGTLKAGATALKTGLTTGVSGTAKNALLKEAGKQAGVGAAYGTLGTLEDKGSDAKAEDIALNTAFGAGIGAALPVVGAGIKKGAVATRNSIKNSKANVAKVADRKTADKDGLNAVLNQSIEEQSDSYGKNLLTRAKELIGDQANPFRALAKIDDEYAKSTGTKRSRLAAEESLEDLARRSAASEREAAGLFEKPLVAKLDDGTEVTGSAKQLVQKYDGDSELGKEFNNYTNAKFDLEFREKKGGNNRIQKGIETDNLKKFIDDYESRNPDAVKDLRIKKAVNDEAVDYLVKSKAISTEEGNLIKNSYKNAVPLERVFPDDLARPEMAGKNLGSIAKQTVIQRLEGGSDIPLSNSFDTMLNRVYKAVSQGNRAKLSQKLLERSEGGHIKDSTIRVTAGNKDARQTIRSDVKAVNKGIRVLERKVKISSRQIRKIQSELNKLNKQGMDVSLKDGGKTPVPDMNIGKLDKLSKEKGKTVSSRQFFKSLIESDPADLNRIKSKIATREPKLAAKIDEVLNTKQQIESNRAAKTDMRNVLADFTDDSTTGKQVLSGVVDGQTFKIEVDPALAKAVQGMDQQKLGPVLKAFAIAKKPFEIAWTGIANPVFSGLSFAFYDTPMSIINSPQGFKTLAPKAIKESLTSIRSSDEFQRALAQNGARPYGGSGSSSFIKPDAKSLAAQKNILKNIKYNAKNPASALSNLDVWGGKLANMTRSRVAYAAAADSMRQQGIKKFTIKDIAANEQAMSDATRAYRTIMPDFDTMSNLTRQINAVLPFYAASIAGTRSFGQAMKRDPLNTSAKALALGIAPITALSAFSLANPAGQEFYKDMEKNSPTTLDNNMIVVLPGASKNKETGEWEGIIKIPIAPEFRAMNQSVWRGVRGAMGGEGPDASHIALSIFDTVTGGVRTSQNPYIDTAKILSGEDPRTGERIIKGSMADLPKNEQRYDSTSDAGGFISDALGTLGVKTSPIQGDKILGQFGLVGATAKNGGDPVGAVAENVGNKFSGARGESAGDAFYKSYSPAKASRDKASREVTSLVKQGRLNEAKRRAEEFNDTIANRFADYGSDFYGQEGDNEDWHDMLNGLYIKTSDNAFTARLKQ